MDRVLGRMKKTFSMTILEETLEVLESNRYTILIDEQESKWDSNYAALSWSFSEDQHSTDRIHCSICPNCDNVGFMLCSRFTSNLAKLD